MSNINSIVVYGISVLSIVLGFVALLLQKVYIDRELNQPTEVELPFFGKLKTNIPAMLFVFFGAALAFFVFQKSVGTKVQWNVDGSFVAQDTTLDWLSGDIKVFPPGMEAQVDDAGKFQLTMFVEEGKSLEDAVESIMYIHPAGSIEIIPREEFEKKSIGEPTLLQSYTQHTRRYSPVNIEIYR